MDQEWIKEVMEKTERLSPFLEKDLVRKLLTIYTLENGSEEIKQEIDSLLGIFSNRLIFSEKPMLECPEKEIIGGEIKVGKVMHGENLLWDFGLSREELNQHLLITARSGAGKTTLIMNLISQLISKHIPFLVFDYKQDYRHLIRIFPEILVINWKDLRLNLLEPPPGVSFQEWKQQFLQIFGHIQGIWHGSTQYLLEAIDKAYERKKSIPKLEDVYEEIVETNETSRKMQEYASVVETRLYGLLSKLGKVVDCQKTLVDIEKILQLPVVLELHGLGRDEATLLSLWFFYWIYAYRRSKGIRGKFLHVLIIDEAKRIFTASEEYSQTTAEYSGIPPADLICDEIRDFGEAILASDQEPTKLSNSLKANTYTKITGFLGNGKDINDIAEAMDLNEEEREALTKLERGEWLVKLAGRWTKPFLIRTADFPLEKNVSDEELKEKMKFKIKSLLKEEKEKQEEKVLTRISSDAWKLLLNINKRPFNGIVSRKNELRFSGARFDKAKKELLSKGLVRQVPIQLTGRRPKVFLVLTDLALKLLESRNMETSLWKHVGNVGFEHVLYQVLIRWRFEKLGFDAHIEAKLENGRRIDVLAVKDKRIGVEIELNANVDLRPKLRLSKELDELYIVTRKEMFYEIKNKLGRLPENVKVYSIDKLLTKLFNLAREYSGINSSKENK